MDMAVRHITLPEDGPAAATLVLISAALRAHLGIPFVFNGAGRDVYNRTYMHVIDLKPFFATIAENHAPHTSGAQMVVRAGDITAARF